jgi:flagellar hook-associated protein 1 FlgK
MGLTGSLLIGQSALAASQVALQVTGNNIANAATPGYSRQRIGLLPTRGAAFSQANFLGRGVQVGEIKRLVEPSVLARLRSSLAQEQSAAISYNVLSQLESITAELSDNDLSSHLQEFFDAFSELANTPGQTGAKALAVEQGASLASFIKSMRKSLDQERIFVEQQLASSVNAANDLLSSIAEINQTIINNEAGDGEDGNLRDQRDVLLDQLANYMEITVIDHDSGAVDVLVNSQPVILGGESRGLELRETPSSSGTIIELITTYPEEEVITVESGSIGGLLENRNSAVNDTIADLDEVTANLIFEVNKLHSVGRPSKPITSLTSERAFSAADQLLALNDPTNETMGELPFAPTNGSFTVRMFDQNGKESQVVIPIDLDGIDATGAYSFADDTTITDIAAALDAIPNLNASINADGTLAITTDTGFEVAFAEDSSGVLAALGVNSYFKGQDGTDIGVRQELIDQPALLAVGFEPDSNQIAIAITNLQNDPVEALGGESIKESWSRRVEQNAVRTAAAGAELSSLETVRASIESQRAAISGVSLDEESINLITYQQQYQGAARFISVVNELTQTLLTLV